MTPFLKRAFFFILLSFPSAAALLLATPAMAVDQPVGDYVLGGAGTILATFDGAGNFSGIAAIAGAGLGNIAGTAPVDANGALAGTFTLTDSRTAAIMASGTLFGSASPGNALLTLKLSTPHPLAFKGGLRSGSEPVPGGQYFGTLLPTSLLFQCDRSINRQVVTLQGDRDFGLDLTQAVAGQLLFNQSGNGFGVVYENGLFTSSPRWATAHYAVGSDKLTLIFYTALFEGQKSRTVQLAGTLSGGKYDGVYIARFTAGITADCLSQAVKVTVKNGVLTGTDTNFGTLTGSISDLGTMAFTSDKLTVPAGCSQSGSYNATVTYSGAPSYNPLFPIVLQGTFAGTGVSGTFTLEQQTGITGATTPGGVPHAEAWAGPMNGVHESPISAGGVFTETYQISFSFSSSLVAAMRGNTQLLTGTGTMTGSETIKTQSPFPAAVSAIVAATTAGGAFNLTFAGVLNGAGPSIEFDSASVLIPGQVTVVAGQPAPVTQFENRKVIKLRISSVSPTLIKGAWADGQFVLRKQ